MGANPCTNIVRPPTANNPTSPTGEIAQTDRIAMWMASGGGGVRSRVIDTGNIAIAETAAHKIAAIGPSSGIYRREKPPAPILRTYVM